MRRVLEALESKLEFVLEKLNTIPVHIQFVILAVVAIAAQTLVSTHLFSF